LGYKRLKSGNGKHNIERLREVAEKLGKPFAPKYCLIAPAQNSPVGDAIAPRALNAI